MSNNVQREIVKYIIGAIAASFCWLLLLACIPMPEQKVRIYDCGMAEWHPDIPKEVEEECRKRRSKNLTST
jgi:hypothetical protein